jgi:hypothetical protein
MFGRSASKPQENYLDNVPVRNVAFEEDEGGRIVLLRPKFMTGPFARLLQPRIPKKFFRVQLDDIGTAAWRAIDGARTVGEIAEILFAEFGGRVEPRHERCSRFVHSLHRGAMVTFAGRPDAGKRG